MDYNLVISYNPLPPQTNFLWHPREKKKWLWGEASWPVRSVDFEGSAWRISSGPRFLVLFPFQVALFMAYKWWLLTTNWDDPPSVGAKNNSDQPVAAKNDNPPLFLGLSLMDSHFGPWNKGKINNLQGHAFLRKKHPLSARKSRGWSQSFFTNSKTRFTTRIFFLQVPTMWVFPKIGAPFSETPM